MRIRLAILGTLALAALGFWLGAWQAIGFQLGVLDVDSRDLAYSVGRQAGSAFPDGCVRQRREDVWRCSARDNNVSESADYLVELDGRCWSGQRIGPRPPGTEGGLPRTITGCVGFIDHIRRFSDRIV
jgi:hypothetical protein